MNCRLVRTGTQYKTLSLYPVWVVFVIQKSKYFRFGFRFISYMYDVATFLTCVFVP